IDADTAVVGEDVVGEDGEVDFKGEAKFQQHLTKGEAVKITITTTSVPPNILY
ncbi:hypothetical protein Tco_0254834, partial [Tanacetum coccineum]